MIYQNYRKFKLPVTLNPLEYGKLITQNKNEYVIQINETNVVLLTQNNDFNHIKLYKKGDFMFEYRDHKITNNKFIRTLSGNEFTFDNYKLINIKYNKSI
jgi:hypothetical protein